jgi:hypothetical protein
MAPAFGAFVSLMANLPPLLLPPIPSSSCSHHPFILSVSSHRPQLPNQLNYYKLPKILKAIDELFSLESLTPPAEPGRIPGSSNAGAHPARRKRGRFRPPGGAGSQRAGSPSLRGRRNEQPLAGSGSCRLPVRPARGRTDRRCFLNQLADCPSRGLRDERPFGTLLRWSLSRVERRRSGALSRHASVSRSRRSSASTVARRTRIHG